MRKLMLGLLLAVSACRSTSTTMQPGGNAGQAGARPALDAFLAAVRSQDLQAMSAVWGDREGAVRDSKRLDRTDVERRELIMMCYFRHDRYRVLSEAPSTGGERVMQVELTKGTITRTTNFYLVNAGDSWYVRNADLLPVTDLCSDPSKRQKK